jgi:hypothetical protein
MAHRFAVLLMLFISLTEHRSSEERQRIDWLQNQGNWTKLTHFQVSKRLPMKSMISVAID